jgi:hypothetical protein
MFYYYYLYQFWLNLLKAPNSWAPAGGGQRGHDREPVLKILIKIFTRLVIWYQRLGTPFFNRRFRLSTLFYCCYTVIVVHVSVSALLATSTVRKTLNGYFVRPQAHATRSNQIYFSLGNISSGGHPTNLIRFDPSNLLQLNPSNLTLILVRLPCVNGKNTTWEKYKNIGSRSGNDFLRN